MLWRRYRGTFRRWLVTLIEGMDWSNREISFFKSQSPHPLRVLAPRVFHLSLRAIGRALAPRIFHLNHHAIELALVPRVFQFNHRAIELVLAPRIFHLNHLVVNSLLHRTSSCLAIDTELLLGEMIVQRSEEHTSELQSPCNLVCRLL